MCRFGNIGRLSLISRNGWYRRKSLTVSWQKKCPGLEFATLMGQVREDEDKEDECQNDE